MKLVANRINQTHLRDILPEISEDFQVDNVLAAIAYGDNAADETKDLVGHAVKNKLRLDLWMRYDHTVPVSVSLLRRLLKHISDNVFTQFIPDRFHAKVIWWKGYGTYIGSANHTDRGWLTNIEAGVFITEDEMVGNGMDIELETFFEGLRNLEKTIPLSSEYIDEMERLNQLNAENYQKSKEARQHEVWEGLGFVDKKTSFDRKRDNFKKEWLSTLGILQNIQSQMEAYRPIWIKRDIPAAWQVDQFLHAYYYNHLGDRIRKPFEDEYSQNKGDPQGTLNTELEWWQSLAQAPSNEDRALYEHAPVVQSLLSNDRILNLTEDEFRSVCLKTHATMDHVTKIPAAVLGRPNLKSLSREERASLFAPLLLKERNRKGWGVLQLLEYVLYGGPETNLWERLYHAGRDPEYRITRYGLNSIAEVVGWARPEVVPPRNGRTSKALRALGFDVKIY